METGKATQLSFEVYCLILQTQITDSLHIYFYFSINSYLSLLLFIIVIICLINIYLIIFKPGQNFYAVPVMQNDAHYFNFRTHRTEIIIFADIAND